MTQPTPPLLGYNNNVRYRGRTFHIQTEDSGTKYARVITHLFVDGGRIVKSTRTLYEELLGAANRAELVRRLMKEQHKSMFLSLRAGQFDDLIERIVGKEPISETPLPSFIEPLTMPANSQVSPSLPTLQENLAARDGASSPPPLAHRAHDGQTDALEAGHRRLAVGTDEVGVERPSGKSRKSRSSVPSAPRRSRVVDDPTPVEFLPPTVTMAPVNSGRPSERLQRPPPAPSSATPEEVQDPRSPSIFGSSGEGRQTLDEVILSFLEEEES